MAELENQDVSRFLTYILEKRGVDLSGYRLNFVARRLLARLDRNKVKDIDAYIVFLERDPAEWEAFAENLSINVSEFFRDPEVFGSFKKNCLAGLIEKAKTNNGTLTIWSCGCSCGEESYSLAILINDYLREKNIDCSFKICATDVDLDALMKARRGAYFKSALANVSSDTLARYFIFLPKSESHLDEDSWQVNASVKQMVSFEKHNLMADGALSGVDAIFLRNVRIYFRGQKSHDVLEAMYDALNDDGYLILGKIESVSLKLRHLFKSVDAINRIYKKTVPVDSGANDRI
jgi:chemotaxis methyl-accepting protein methylase